MQTRPDLRSTYVPEKSGASGILRRSIECTHRRLYTVYTQKNDAFSKVNKKFISHLIRAQRTPSAAATVQVSHALPAVRSLVLTAGLRGQFQDGVAAGKGFLCAPF